MLKCLPKSFLLCALHLKAVSCAWFRAKPFIFSLNTPQEPLTRFSVEVITFALNGERALAITAFLWLFAFAGLVTLLHLCFSSNTSEVIDFREQNPIPVLHCHCHHQHHPPTRNVHLPTSNHTDIDVESQMTENGGAAITMRHTIQVRSTVQDIFRVFVVKHVSASCYLFSRRARSGWDFTAHLVESQGKYFLKHRIVSFGGLLSVNNYGVENDDVTIVNRNLTMSVRAINFLQAWKISQLFIEKEYQEEKSPSTISWTPISLKTCQNLRKVDENLSLLFWLLSRK